MATYHDHYGPACGAPMLGTHASPAKGGRTTPMRKGGYGAPPRSGKLARATGHRPGSYAAASPVQGFVLAGRGGMRGGQHGGNPAGGRY